MRRPSKQMCLKIACQVLRGRVRYRNAAFRLSDRCRLSHDDTETIRKATALFVETWIVPILDRLEEEDWDGVYELTRGEPLEPRGLRGNV